MEYTIKPSNLTDFILGKLMESVQGEELQKALKATIEDEKQCLEQFKILLSHCKTQIDAIIIIEASGKSTHDLLKKKRAFEEEQIIVNVAAQCQLCSFETKEKQLQLYFEKDEHQRARLAVEASVIMYERCDDLQQLTGKQFQEISQRLLSESELGNLRAARKSLNEYYKQEKSRLADVRHNVGAHRDLDFMKEMEVLEGLGWADTIERLHRFEKVTLELGQSLKPLMDACLRQISKAFGEER